MSLQIISILANTIDLFFKALSFLIILRILLSWLAPAACGGLAQFIFATTEPVLGIFRKLNLRIGMFDLTPLIALLALELLRDILIRILIGGFFY